VKGVQKMYEVFEQLLQKYDVTPYKVAKEAGVTQTALSNWKLGKSTPTTQTLQKIADYFGVTIDYLMTGKEELEKKETTLTPKDTRDIEKILDSTREQLLTQEGLMFDGDPATPEAIESILSAMQIGMEMAKKKNKEKYAPKKYRKD
jgi:Predicted transcriptional regulators